jgi:CRP-like cAMP-binding protein
MSVDIGVLERAALFRPLGRPALERLAAASDRRIVEAGDAVFTEGAKAEKVYLLETGHVAIEIEIGSGYGRTIVHTASAGECFGWSAIIPPFRFTASARAVEHSAVVEVPGAAIEAAFADGPAGGVEVLREFARMISLRLKDTRFQLVNMLHWPGDRRA